MDLGDLLDLYRYNDWANARLHGAVCALPLATTRSELAGSFPTLRALLAHVAGAEWVWLQRFRGASPTALPEWAESGDAAALCAELAAIAARRSAFLSGLSEGALDARLAFRYLSGAPGSLTLRDALFHVANHATYHRGQLASMLRALGGAPPATDFSDYRVETDD